MKKKVKFCRIPWNAVHDIDGELGWYKFAKLSPTLLRYHTKGAALFENGNFVERDGNRRPERSEETTQVSEELSKMILLSVSMVFTADSNFLLCQYIAFKQVSFLFPYKLRYLQALSAGVNQKLVKSAKYCSTQVEDYLGYFLKLVGF